MVIKKEIFSWSVYDLANTAFSALFVTFFFPVLIKNHLGGNEFQIGLVFGISMFLAGTLVPFIGAISDQTKRRMPYIIFFTLICVAFTIMTAFGSLLWALGFALVANFAFHAALDVYDAKLVDLSTKKNIGKISSYGIALGYVGTILSLVMGFILLQIYGNTYKGAQAILIGTGIFFLVFATYTFLTLKDKQKGKPIHKKAIKKAWKNMVHTFSNIKKHKNVFTFLIASLFFTDGMNTAIIFLFLFGQEQIGIQVSQFFILFGFMALAAAGGALLFGKISDKIGSKKSLVIILTIWIVIMFMLMIYTNFTTYIITGIIGGAMLGATWTVTRPMLVKLAPKDKVAQLFGFQGMTEKYSGVIGPILFGYVVTRAGYQPALWVLISFFVIGLILMKFVKIK